MTRKPLIVLGLHKDPWHNTAALGRVGQEVQPRQGALHDHRALLLKQGVLDEHAAPFGEQAQGVVEGCGVRAASQCCRQLGLDLLRQCTHTGVKCVCASAFNSSSLRGDLLASAQRSK